MADAAICFPQSSLPLGIAAKKHLPDIIVKLTCTQSPRAASGKKKNAAQHSRTPPVCCPATRGPTRPTALAYPHRTGVSLAPVACLKMDWPKRDGAKKVRDRATTTKSNSNNGNIGMFQKADNTAPSDLDRSCVLETIARSTRKLMRFPRPALLAFP